MVRKPDRLLPASWVERQWRDLQAKLKFHSLDKSFGKEVGSFEMHQEEVCCILAYYAIDPERR
jgi:hypothetical protein